MTTRLLVWRKAEQLIVHATDREDNGIRKYWVVPWEEGNKY
jgi:hypothetical protein